ncbi:organoarsenical effux MFS transporter ArsJ [Thiomicrorhabdus xiamenensis]|uniref:Organoarsenical effux MFS transporter ArsJ n=1 Tax=Thiomicrorhabdus xiamenensis TaxID=2739063 RepID=A0A7D4SJG1_9GAMM|nr:organoarsenical effux MFS transporter ArsJ [Thiomicrorhabdus xiamenensis]QKI89959.1 organoarsenical effux MFS transporter ArsJ [Thiomicrorhabdus xiamenensis]
MSLHSPVAQYGIVTANYWAFTVTDGALRMLVLLFFHQLGYSPLEIAMLFLLYEFFGIVTNLFGGWLGAHLGLKVTMNLGLALQVVALLMLTVDPSWLSVAYVMLAQALSGIAKDLNKMSAKSSIKSLTQEKDGQMYRWVALLTGSKNALKGAGFFVGALLLELVGFADAMLLMASVLAVIWLLSLLMLQSEIGKAKQKNKFREIFSKSQPINMLSAARFFLFGARDIWFVVALPLYLATVLQWEHTAIGAYMAFWIIGYGMVQASAPALTGIKKGGDNGSRNPTANTAKLLAFTLGAIPFLMALFLNKEPQWILLIGLVIFGIVFALNSAVHSYLIVSYADADGASKDVGFYYMANAAGRLVGTLLSGYVYQVAGMEACLMTAAVFVLLAGLLAGKIRQPASVTAT